MMTAIPLSSLVELREQAKAAGFRLRVDPQDPEPFRLVRPHLPDEPVFATDDLATVADWLA